MKIVQLKSKSKFDKSDKYVRIWLFVLSYSVHITFLVSYYRLPAACIYAKIQCRAMFLALKAGDSILFNKNNLLPVSQLTWAKRHFSFLALQLVSILCGGGSSLLRAFASHSTNIILGGTTFLPLFRQNHLTTLASHSSNVCDIPFHLVGRASSSNKVRFLLRPIAFYHHLLPRSEDRSAGGNHSWCWLYYRWFLPGLPSVSHAGESVYLPRNMHSMRCSMSEMR